MLFNAERRFTRRIRSQESGVRSQESFSNRLALRTMESKVKLSSLDLSRILQLLTPALLRIFFRSLIECLFATGAAKMKQPAFIFRLIVRFGGVDRHAADGVLGSREQFPDPATLARSGSHRLFSPE